MTTSFSYTLAKPEDNEKKPTKPVNLSLKTTTEFGDSP